MCSPTWPRPPSAVHGTTFERNGLLPLAAGAGAVGLVVASLALSPRRRPETPPCPRASAICSPAGTGPRPRRPSRRHRRRRTGGAAARQPAAEPTAPDRVGLTARDPPRRPCRLDGAGGDSGAPAAGRRHGDRRHRGTAGAVGPVEEGAPRERRAGRWRFASADGPDRRASCWNHRTRRALTAVAGHGGGRLGLAGVVARAMVAAGLDDVLATPARSGQHWEAMYTWATRPPSRRSCGRAPTWSA